MKERFVKKMEDGDIKEEEGDSTEVLKAVENVGVVKEMVNIEFQMCSIQLCYFNSILKCCHDNM